MSVLVVGAGFAGAVHARVLAEQGYDVVVIDKRDHIGGNCYDYLDSTGVRIHKYGPHLFHTSNQRVVDWLSDFTDWVPYEHRVVAKLSDGKLVPLPVNLRTVNIVFNQDLKCEADARDFLAKRAIPMPANAVRTAEDHLHSIIGTELTDLFFRPYTKKMWDMDLSTMDAAVVQRLQIRFDHEDRYFPNDSFQAMPKHGYTKLFENIFDHKKISVRLDTQFAGNMLDQHDYCFNSMPIDLFFDKRFGELPYRSIKFDLRRVEAHEAPDHVTINYTDTGRHTRETWWHNIPNHVHGDGRKVVCTVEEPCDYKDNNFERYYPVKTHDGRLDAQYQKYRALAEDLEKIEFIGRCGLYQYLDMHQVINQSLMNAGRWLNERA